MINFVKVTGEFQQSPVPSYLHNDSILNLMQLGYYSYCNYRAIRLAYSLSVMIIIFFFSLKFLWCKRARARFVDKCACSMTLRTAQNTRWVCL